MFDAEGPYFQQSSSKEVYSTYLRWWLYSDIIYATCNNGTYWRICKRCQVSNLRRGKSQKLMLISNIGKHQSWSWYIKDEDRVTWEPKVCGSVVWYRTGRLSSFPHKRCNSRGSLPWKTTQITRRRIAAWSGYSLAITSHRKSYSQRSSLKHRSIEREYFPT